jgi:hypothetical protein
MTRKIVLKNFLENFNIFTYPCSENSGEEAAHKAAGENILSGDVQAGDIRLGPKSISIYNKCIKHDKLLTSGLFMNQFSSKLISSP